MYPWNNNKILQTLVVSGENDVLIFKTTAEKVTVRIADNDIKEAVNEAVKKSQEVAARKLSQMGGGLKGLLGGMGQ